MSSEARVPTLEQSLKLPVHKVPFLRLSVPCTQNTELPMVSRCVGMCGADFRFIWFPKVGADCCRGGRGLAPLKHRAPWRMSFLPSHDRWVVLGSDSFFAARYLYLCPVAFVPGQ